MPEVFIRFEVICFCSFHNTVDNCACLRTIDSINQLPVFSSNSKGTDRTLRSRVVDGDEPVIQEKAQIFFGIETVGKAFSGLSLWRDIVPMLFYPCEERINPRFYRSLTPFLPFLRWKLLKFLRTLPHQQNPVWRGPSSRRRTLLLLNDPFSCSQRNHHTPDSQRSLSEILLHDLHFGFSGSHIV